MNPPSRDPFARPSAGPFVLSHDHFRDQKAARAPRPPKQVAARQIEKPVETLQPEPPQAASVQRPVSEKKPLFGMFDPKPREAAMQPEKVDDFHRELVDTPGAHRLSNGAELKVVAPSGDAGDMETIHGGDRLILRRKTAQGKAGKTSSLVLVSGAGPMAAAETAIDADFEEGAADVSEKPKSKPEKLRRSRGGGGAGDGGGGIRPPAPKIDRAFNQDDLVSVLIVLALLLIGALFLMRGNGAPAAKPEQLASIQSAPAAAPAPPAGPPPDPFGDQPKVLVPAPVAPAPVEPAPAPTPACNVGHTMRAWFCTNESQLTDKAKGELEKELADWNACFKDRELVIAGYADTRGPATYNTWLGGERAKTIADYLKSKGIKVAQLTPVGELDGLDDNQNCSNQRRVDISFKGEEPEPSRSCAPPSDFAALVCG